MYVTKNIYESYATYIDLPDTDFFHEALENAKTVYKKHAETIEDMSQESIKELKNRSVPVMYVTTVSKRKADDFKLIRTDMNERARRKFLIIDADFSEGEDSTSEKLRENIIRLAEQLNTPLVIYPTHSYPEKPRFRAVFFTKQLLDAASYMQAMTWLYDMLGIYIIKGDEDPIIEVLNEDEIELSKGVDRGNLHIKSNNNAPFFTNETQLDYIVDTTQDDSLELLDKSLWGNFPKPKIAKPKVWGSKTAIDEYSLSNDILKAGCLAYAKTDEASSFDTFWRFLHSLARAEFYGQITSDQVQSALTWVATNPNKSKQSKWIIDNKERYKIERDRVHTRDDYLKRAKPLVAYPAFADLIKNQIESM